MQPATPTVIRVQIVLPVCVLAEKLSPQGRFGRDHWVSKAKKSRCLPGLESKASASNYVKGCLRVTLIWLRLWVDRFASHSTTDIRAVCECLFVVIPLSVQGGVITTVSNRRTMTTKGQKINEGKTKIIYDFVDSAGHGDTFVLIESKDKISAFDGTRSHDLEGKAAISNSTNAKVFEFLNAAGYPTAFIKKHEEKSFIARKCHMIPLEWVTRRTATGSFLKRNPGVKEGFRFAPPKLETFLKDDAKKDPQWSEEQILEAGLEFGGVRLGKLEYDYMAKMTVSVFEALEKAWSFLDCALVDMKIEFGIDNKTNKILLADVIDSDSWRLWPSGDKRLMKDKQVYRNLKSVTDEALIEVRRNFQWVADKLDNFIPISKALVVIVMGSPSDKIHCEMIGRHCQQLGLTTALRVCSAHKTTEDTLKLIAEYEAIGVPVVFIAVAGRSNGLGPVLAANTVSPVINCPPLQATDFDRDIWSSLNTPSGLGCTTVLYPEAAAQHAASVLALNDSLMFAKLKAKQLKLWLQLKESDREFIRSNYEEKATA